jgi:hypothetical protein
LQLAAGLAAGTSTATAVGVGVVWVPPPAGRLALGRAESRIALGRAESRIARTS